MKKTLILSACASLSLLFSSCKSAPITFDNRSPIGILSVMGNSAITWYSDKDSDEDMSDGLLTTMVNKLIDSNNPEVTTGVDRADYTDESLRSMLEEIGGVKVIAKDKVLKSSTYQAYSRSPLAFLDTSVAATGYTKLGGLSAKTARNIMREIGAKSLIIANIDCHKTLYSGNNRNGKVQGMVTLKIKFIDERGKEIVNKEFTVLSDDLVIMRGRKYDKAEFVESFKELIDNSIKLFIMEYVGNGVIEDLDSDEVDAISLPVKPRPNAGTAEPNGESSEKVEEKVVEKADSAIEAESEKTPSSDDLSKTENELKELKSLFDKGLITEDEYKAKKAKVLGL